MSDTGQIAGAQQCENTFVQTCGDIFTQPCLLICKNTSEFLKNPFNPIYLQFVSFSCTFAVALATLYQNKSGVVNPQMIKGGCSCTFPEISVRL